VGLGSYMEARNCWTTIGMCRSSEVKTGKRGRKGSAWEVERDRPGEGGFSNLIFSSVEGV